MRRKENHVLAQAGVYLLARGAPGILSFLAIPLFSRLLEPEEYGRFALLIAIVNLGNSLLFQWLRLAVVRFMPGQRHDTGALRDTLLGATLGISAILGAGVAIACLFPIGNEWRAMLLACWVVLAVHAMFELCCEHTRSLMRPWRYMVMQVLRSGVGLGAGVTLAWLGWGWWAPLLGLAGGMSIGVAYAYASEWRGTRPRIDPRLLAALARYGVPVSLTVAMVVVIGSSDRFLIALMIGEHAAGVYAVAADLTSQTIGLLMMVVFMPLFPLAVHAWESEGRAAAVERMRSNGALQLAIGLPCVAGLTVLTPGVAHCILGQDFRAEAVALIPLVAVAALLAGLKAYHFDASFQFVHKTLYQTLIVVVAAVANIALNVLMIPWWGVQGAAIASILAYVLALALTIALGSRHVALPIPLGDVARVALATVAMATLLYPFRGHVHPLALAAQVAGGAAAYAAVLVGTNFMNLGHAAAARLRPVARAARAESRSDIEAGGAAVAGPLAEARSA
ncbi:MAG TPA: oligosaccharide flippase family protein [Tepidisphaeraceae bacterium]|nr:oligosaccharide flippase family protein [Tepidisphaeraceae bacterium]